MSAVRLAVTRLRRARVAAQRLGGRAGDETVAGVVAGVVGVPAQDEGAAGLAVRARSRGLVAGDVAAALTDDRSVVLTWSFRGTRHLHAAADVRWLIGLLGPVLGRPGRRARQLGIDGRVGEEAVRRLRHLLAAEGPLTRPAVQERLAAVGVDPSGQAAVHVLQRAAFEGVLCIVPDPAGERYVLLDDWVPEGEVLDPDRAEAELARRHLAAFGPAAPADFAAWSGLGVVAARRAWAAIGAELVEVDGPGGPWWALAERTGELGGAGAAPLRLLGAFDPMLLGYADRSLVLAPEHAGRVNAGGGMVRPVVLDDGRVVATWVARRTARAVRLEVRPFRRLSARQAVAVEEEAADIGRFLGRDPSVTVAAPPATAPGRTPPGRGR